MTEPLFFDTDCISAFLWVDNECILSKLFPKRIIIPKEVYDELSHPGVNHVKGLKAQVDVMIQAGEAIVETIMVGTDTYELYRKLTNSPNPGHKIIGRGEAASISLAKEKQGILARACLKIHSCNLHAPLWGIFASNSVSVARYASFIRCKSPTNWNAHLAESIFQTRSSNNLKDISDYVEEYGLAHLTTGDIMKMALDAGYISETQGNVIWTNMLARRRKLGYATFSDYLEDHQMDNEKIKQKK